MQHVHAAEHLMNSNAMYRLFDIDAGRTNAADRDYATAAAAAMCISHGANIIRAHNVAAVKDAAAVADAMRFASHATQKQH